MLFHIAGGALIIIAASNVDVFKFTNFPVPPVPPIMTDPVVGCGV